MLTKLINPDLIVHERGVGKNLIAFEFKKSTSIRNPRFDEIKLKFLKDSYRYEFAYFIQLSTGAKFAIAAVVLKNI